MPGLLQGLAVAFPQATGSAQGARSAPQLLTYEHLADDHQRTAELIASCRLRRHAQLLLAPLQPWCDASRSYSYYSQLECINAAAWQALLAERGIAATIGTRRPSERLHWALEGAGAISSRGCCASAAPAVLPRIGSQSSLPHWGNGCPSTIYLAGGIVHPKERLLHQALAVGAVNPPQALGHMHGSP